MTFKYLHFSVATVRLVDGTHSAEGIVKVYHHGSWGSVCSDNWNDADARVVCRQLGYSFGTTQDVHDYDDSGYSIGSSGQNNEDGVLNNIRCAGSESTLVECPHT